jgi:hypothetical protein
LPRARHGGGRSGDRGRVEPTDRLDDAQASAHRPLGIVLVGLRIAEISEHAVAHIFGDETVETSNRRRYAAVIGADHLAQFFRVEPRRKRRRADQVAEHHGQLAAFGLGGGRSIGDRRPQRGGGR